MATTKFSNAFAFNKINSGATNLNKRVQMDELMAILVERQRAAVCLRSKGVPDDQAAHCGCTFCSPEAQREKFGATIKEMDAQFAEEAAWTAARGKRATSGACSPMSAPGTTAGNLWRSGR
jgi:hypothetical protein